VKDQLESLVRLQEIDLQLQRIETEKQRQPLELEEARRPLSTAQKQLEETRARMDVLSKSKRDKERDLQVQEESIEKFKARQSEIKTNKEYQAYLHELETARVKKGLLEEELLALMEELDQQARQVKAQEQLVVSSEKEFSEKKREFELQATRLGEEMRRFEAERESVQNQIEEKLRRSYQRLKSALKDLAVVPIVQGACGGCHMNLPPQLLAEVKMHAEIRTCSHCHRILYWSRSAERPDSAVDMKPAAKTDED
jgi:predicted  nucleic acid-binding Zn-ribbon protein